MGSGLASNIDDLPCRASFGSLRLDEHPHPRNQSMWLFVPCLRVPKVAFVACESPSGSARNPGIARYAIGNADHDIEDPRLEELCTLCKRPRARIKWPGGDALAQDNETFSVGS